MWIQCWNCLGKNRRKLGLGRWFCGGEPIKVLVVADTVHPILYEYFDKERFSDIDVILSAGDLRPKFLSYLVSMLNKRCYYVRGNHDKIYGKEPPLGCQDLHGKLVVHEGIRILGLEGSMWYGGQGVEYRETQMCWKVFWLGSRIRWNKGIDIVLTHAPPQGTHDGKDICHTGFTSFARLIKKYKPRYFIHGHTHGSYGYTREKITKVNGTQVVNVDGYYTFEIEPIIQVHKCTSKYH